MGVFGRFFGRKDQDATTEAAVPETLTATPEDAEAVAAEAEVQTAEAVEIPKQQSVEAAADSETGEGART
ncbi:gliding motility protein [Streptomyces sp. NPDC046557]|uniref:gliding motility protein n=1 Tax=Streptomyces sp. NPDC046557 TaxID=3155372 RepID=UPI003406824D